MPSLNFNGTDTFRYIVNDGVSDSTPATVSITVNAIDDAPVAEDDSYVTTVNTPLNVPSNGVLTNDSDVENDPLTANLVIASGPVNGALFLNLNGSFSYIPNPGFVGSDSFSYFANDGTLDSNVALVSIQVNNPVVPNGSAVPPVIVLGDQTALSSSPTGGTGVYVNFDWSGPGFSSNVQNPGSVSPPSLGANDYTVTVTDSAGFTGSETITVFVIASELQANPAVTATVGGTTTTGASAVIFVGDSVALSSEPTGGSGIYETFSWTGPGFSSSTQNPGAVVPPGPGTHLYSLTVTDSFGLTSTQSVTVVASESVADQGIYLKKGWVRYRAFRDSSLTSPNDSFTLTVEGIKPQVGDRLSFAINGHLIGDVSNSSGLILGSNYQAAGQLGAIPNVFTNCKIKYNSRRYRLKIKAAKGSFSGGLPIVQGTAGLSSIVLVGVFIDRPPYGGVPNQAFGLPMLFQVTVRTDGSGVVSEAGKAAEF